MPSAIKRGIKEAKGEIVSWLDCGLDMPPEKIPQMVRLLEKNDIVIGSTFVKGGKDARGVVYASFFSRLINLFCQLVLGKEITDYTSGFIVTKKKAIEGSRFEGAHGSYFIGLLYRAKKKGYKIIEVPYTLLPRQYGQSKITGFWPYFKTGIVYLWTLFKLRFFARIIIDDPQGKSIYLKR